MNYWSVCLISGQLPGNSGVRRGDVDVICRIFDPSVLVQYFCIWISVCVLNAYSIYLIVIAAFENSLWKSMHYYPSINIFNCSMLLWSHLEIILIILFFFLHFINYKSIPTTSITIVAFIVILLYRNDILYIYIYIYTYYELYYN